MRSPFSPLPLLALLALLVLPAITLAGRPASAVTLDVSTSVAEATGPQAGFFEAGDSIDIHAEVSDSVADNDATVGRGVFPGALSALQVTFPDGLVFSAGAAFSNGVETLDDQGLAPDLSDSVILEGLASLSGTLGGLTVTSIVVTLSNFGAAPDLVVSDDIADPPPAVQLVSIDVTTSAGTTRVQNFTITVPEPGLAALLLAAAGLGGPALRRR